MTVLNVWCSCLWNYLPTNHVNSYRFREIKLLQSECSWLYFVIVIHFPILKLSLAHCLLKYSTCWWSRKKYEQLLNISKILNIEREKTFAMERYLEFELEGARLWIRPAPCLDKTKRKLTELPMYLVTGGIPRWPHRERE